MVHHFLYSTARTINWVPLGKRAIAMTPFNTIQNRAYFLKQLENSFSIVVTICNKFLVNNIAYVFFRSKHVQWILFKLEVHFDGEVILNL